MINISEENFEAFAMKHYLNDCVFSFNEFHEDLAIIRYIRNLLKRYRDTGELRERLLLNHIISMGNVFTIEAVVKMIFFKIDEQDYHIIKPFLAYLNYLPKVVHNVDGKDIWASDIPDNPSIIALLGRL